MHDSEAPFHSLPKKTKTDCHKYQKNDQMVEDMCNAVNSLQKQLWLHVRCTTWTADDM